MSDKFDNVPDGPDSHRQFYRGKDITSAFDNGTFSARVADGTFRDIFPGDFIRKKVYIPLVVQRDYMMWRCDQTKVVVKFIIADLDIACNEKPFVRDHQAVIVPEEPIFDTYMNPTRTNKGGYVRSYMNRTVMPDASNCLRSAFGYEHLLDSNLDGSHPSTCRLMTLSMVFGQTPKWYPGYSWSEFDKDKCLGGVQLAAFRLNPNLCRTSDKDYWLSDSYIGDSYIGYGAFAKVLNHYGFTGFADSSSASDYNIGVRPFALLV